MKELALHLYVHPYLEILVVYCFLMIQVDSHVKSGSRQEWLLRASVEVSAIAAMVLSCVRLMVWSGL
jgi:hypothetical protein